MSEIKIEVGKFYCTKLHPTHKLICVDATNMLFYDYNIEGLYRHNERFISIGAWKEELKVGWVYESNNGNTYKVLFDREKLGIIPRYVIVDIVRGITDSADYRGCIESYNKLKLETGRPADE